ncbi:MAG: hypothetical protein AVDCRST_MAG53-1281, partial [uncultured Solirubrobacteraceae bacterium]
AARRPAPQQPPAQRPALRRVPPDLRADGSGGLVRGGRVASRAEPRRVRGLRDRRLAADAVHARRRRRPCRLRRRRPVHQVPPRGPRALGRRRDDGDRRGHPHAAGLSLPRPVPERPVGGAQRGAGAGGGDTGAVGAPRQGGARGGRGPRDRAHPQPRRTGDDLRGGARRVGRAHRRAAVPLRLPRLRRPVVVRRRAWRRLHPGRPARAGRGAGGAAGRLSAARAPGRRDGRRSHALPAGTRFGAAQDLRLGGGAAALAQPGHPHVHRPARGRGRKEQGAVLQPSPAGRAPCPARRAGRQPTPRAPPPPAVGRARSAAGGGRPSTSGFSL